MAATLMNVHSYSTATCVSELIMELHPVAIDTNYRTLTLKSLLPLAVSKDLKRTVFS